MTLNLSLEQKQAVSRISGLVVVNAMIFQEILAEHNPNVHPLQRILSDRNPIASFCDHWDMIVTEIDYYPIFHVAREVLLNLTANADTVNALNELARTAQRVVMNRAALRHDLMGRVYHRLLSEAKYLGTFYTSIPSAAFLLRLVLQPRLWNVEWHNADAIRQLRVADLACGTGTLLTAVADAITDNYVSASADQGQAVDLGQLQNVIAEEVLHGYDVLPSAIHLTASTLAMRSPDTAFKKMNLYSLPLGGVGHRLGSIEFLSGKEVPLQLDLFGSTDQITGTDTEKHFITPLPDLNLCVMNPPFVRSVGGNLLFGSVPDDERKPMQKKLQKMIQDSGLLANSTAGLGSVFIAAAHGYIKPGGRLALILPKALLSGGSWRKSRQLINQHYRIEMIIVTHDAQHWNFSDSTDLSETMIFAVKNELNQVSNPEKFVTAINLWRTPTTSFEAAALAHIVINNDPPDIQTGQGALELVLGEEKMGEVVRAKWDTVKSNWFLPVSFAQSDLIRCVSRLMNGEVWLPGRGKVGSIPLTPLEELGTLGPDQRDIHDGFSVSNAETIYPAFWNHDSQHTVSLAQKPNMHLIPLHTAKKGRHLRNADRLWELAGTVLLCERLRVNTQRLVAIRVDKKVLTNTWWTFSLDKTPSKDVYEKALTLWLNSTCGIILILAHRVETQGAWVKFKKPSWMPMPVIDLNKLTQSQLDHLASVYDSVADQALQPFPQMEEDETRAKIDRGIEESLGLPDVSVLRHMLSREPVVCMKRIGER